MEVFRNLRRPGLIWAVIALYCLLGCLLIAQKPGLQYDEAMLVAGAVHTQHSTDVFELDNTPDAWICPFHRCLPLMAFVYVGPMKEYVSLPFFAIFGPRTWVIRLVSLMFGALGIWGISKLIGPWFGQWAAILAAFALAINPAYLNMVIFDNGATSALMGVLGLTCACISLYATRSSVATAFGLGLAMGFGVWTRANFAWVLVAGGVAALIVLGRRILIPVSHATAIVAGGILGGLPFLLYQVLSGGATWKVQGLFASSEPMASLIRQRIFLLADTLLSDGEHRAMWGGPPLPVWQLCFFPGVVVLACLVCLLWSGREESGPRSLARFLTLTVLITLGIEFFSRLPVAEHHLVLVLPLAIAVVVSACAILQRRLHYTWLISVMALAIYGASAIYWQVESIRGLRRSGGLGVWSNAGLDLARTLDRDYRDREIKMIDWGFQYNLYVLTNGRLKPKEIYSGSSEDLSGTGRPWIDEIREGGVFLLHGAEDRQYPKPSEGFLKALGNARPLILHSQRIQQQDGITTYARIIDIAPNSVRGPRGPGDAPDVHIPMNDSRFDSQLTGFYPPDPGGFRWTKREFSATLDLSHLSPVDGLDDPQLLVHFYIPDDAIRRLGSVTLRTRVGAHALAPEVFTRGGQSVFRRPLETSWMGRDAVRVDFSLDKALHEPGMDADPRELGIVVAGISVEPE